MWRSLPAFLLVAAAGAADPPAPGTVAATGSVEVRRQPDTLRVQFDIAARGKTLKEALDGLRQRRDEVRAALTKLGAAADRVTVGDPTLPGDLADRQNQVERMMRERNRALGKPPKKGEAPAVVSATVRADFPLLAGDAEAFLLASHDLQQRVKAADLGGLKGKKSTPEEEEAAEEIAGQPGRPDTNERDPGEPVFLFVGRVSEADRAKALAEAFAKARGEAERLAAAAGAQLGGLHHLANQFGPGGDPDGAMGMSQGEYFYAMQQGRLGRAMGEVAAGEAVGLQASKVTLRVGVAAQFVLIAPAHR